MTWRIDETALFDHVARYLGQPSLETEQREQVRALTRQIALAADEVHPDQVSATVREVSRRVYARLAELADGSRSTESPVSRLDLATLSALDQLAGGASNAEALRQ